MAPTMHSRAALASAVHWEAALLVGRPGGTALASAVHWEAALASEVFRGVAPIFNGISGVGAGLSGA